MKNILKKIISEEIITLTSSPDTKIFYHGGNLSDVMTVDTSYKKGRHEFGFGLYLTSHYETAYKYSKGSRKLYVVTVYNGNDIGVSTLELNDCINFINQYILKNKRNTIINAITNKSVNNKIKAYIFHNLILNYDAIKSSNGKYLRDFLVSNKIDYEIIENAFGWGEEMMVLYNKYKIKDIKQIKPNDKIVIDK